MVNKYFVLYCLNGMRVPKIYKREGSAKNMCQESSYKYESFEDQTLANNFYKFKLDQQKHNIIDKNIQIVKHNLQNYTNETKLANPKVKAVEKVIQDISPDERTKRQSFINDLFLQNHLFKKPCFLSTNKSLNNYSEFAGFFDGCCKGNPGKAGAGYHIDSLSDRTTIIENHHFLGLFKTNNQAQSLALNLLLADAYCNGINNLKVYGDSELIIRFMTGKNMVSNMYLIGIINAANKIARQFKKISFEHVGREYNGKADKLSNLALKNIVVKSQQEIKPVTSLAKTTE